MKSTWLLSLVLLASIDVALKGAGAVPLAATRPAFEICPVSTREAIKVDWEDIGMMDDDCILCGIEFLSEMFKAAGHFLHGGALSPIISMIPTTLFDP